VRRVIEEATNERDFSVFDELVSPDFVDHEAGPEGEKGLTATVAAVFPDWHLTTEDQVAEGDKVVSRLAARGTHRGEFMGRPPTGRRVEVSAINLARVEGGKIVESWGNSDQPGMLRQIGVVPEAVRF
jgi:predicted ester cyclase